MTTNDNGSDSFKLGRQHQQVWVKVNAPVDQGVAEIVFTLNSVDGLATLESCQGDAGGPDAYVYFSYGGWPDVCDLIFAKMGPVLKREFDEDVVLTVEATSGTWPMAKISFKTEITGCVVAALKRVLN